MSLAVFGEITSSNGESSYTWANAVTITLLSKLNNIEGFENIQAPDIINAGLVFLNLFFNIHIDKDHKEENENIIREMVFDEKAFKDMLNMAIAHGKMHNIMLNDEIILAGDKDGF